MTPAWISAWLIRQASGWYSETCEPRRSGSAAWPVRSRAGPPAVGQPDQVAGQQGALVLQGLDTGLAEQPGALLHGHRAQDVRRSSGEPGHGGQRIVGRAHRELPRAGRTSPGSAGAAGPAGPAARTGTRARPGPRSGTCTCSPRPGRRRWRPVRPGPRRPSGTGPRAPARPRRAPAAVRACHVGQRAAPVGDMRQADQRGVRPDRTGQRGRADPRVQVGVDHRQFGPELAATPSALPVGWEVVVVGHDDPAAGLGPQRRAGQLVQVDRGRVAHHDLPGRGADSTEPSRSPACCGRLTQPAQDRTRPSPHCSATTSPMRCAVIRGSMPSDFPSR